MGNEPEIMPENESIEKDIREMKRALYGYNNHTGLIATVENNRKALEEIKETLKWANRLMASLIATLIVYGLWNLLIMHGPIQ